MYVPNHFRLEDPRAVREIMVRYPFATIISSGPDGPYATHVPVLTEVGEPLVIAAHFAKANPHWKLFDSSMPTLAIFHGPHAYVSPALYVVPGSVPTWDYATVHAYGFPQIIEDPDEALAHVQAVTRTFDPQLEVSHPASTEESMVRRMLGGIVAFRMKVDRFEAKVKLNQNKHPEDREAVAEAFLASEDAVEREVGRMIRELTSSNPFGVR